MIHVTSLGVSSSEYLSFSQFDGEQGLRLRVISLDILKRTGSIRDSKSSPEGVVGEECWVFEGPGVWPAWNANSPVVWVPSMRLLILLNRGNPFLWKGFTLSWLWKEGGGAVRRTSWPRIYTSQAYLEVLVPYSRRCLDMLCRIIPAKSW